VKAGKSTQGMPRVLILSEEIPQTVHAGGIILHRLFAGYGEGEKLKSGKAEWLTGENAEPRLFVIGPKAHPDAEVLDCPYCELRMPWQRLEKTRLHRLKRSLQAAGLIPLPSHRQVVRLLGHFRPEVVVSVMQGTPFISLAARTARAFGVRLVLIVHDLNEEFERVYPWAKEPLFRRNRSVYRQAARRLCVSQEMARYLENRYGAPGEVMYPNRSEELMPRAADLSLTLRAAADQRTSGLRDERSKEDEDDFDKGNSDILKDAQLATSSSPQTSAPLTLGYAGSLAYGYGEELVRLIEVLRETGTRIRLFSPRPAGRLAALNEAHDVVEKCGYRPALEAWREIQVTCDAVILPYANPARDQELLYRTHFPSKLTEYLALGMPVIVSGQGFANGVRYAQAEKLKNGKAENLKLQAGDCQSFGLANILEVAPNGVVPCTTREELLGCLWRMKEDGELRRELARRATEAGKRDFDPVAIRERFWEVMGGERQSRCGR